MGLFSGAKIFPGLFGGGSRTPDAGANNNSFGGLSLRDFVPDAAVRESWANLYMKVVQSRQQFYQEMDKVKSFYLVDALARNVADDALIPEISSGEVVQMTSPKPEIQEELEVLQSRINFDQLIGDFMIDLLRQGEHVLAQEVVPGEGVVEVKDEVDQSKVLAFYRFGYPSVFVAKTNRQTLEVRRPYQYAHFAINRYKLRIKIQREFNVPGADDTKDFEGRELPSYARIGRSIFYGVLSKIKELMLVELLIPTKKLNDIMKGNLVGLRMPQATSPKDGFEASKVYEKFLNKKVGLNRSSDEFSVADVVSIAGSLRILPIFGEKGTLENLGDIKDDRSLDALADRIEDTRRVICTSIGYPYELMFGSDNDRRGELLKRYGRYIRMLRSIQSALANGLQQIGISHIVNRGMSVSPNDIVVSFRNKLVEVDELDKIELLDAVVNIVSNVQRTVTELMEDEHLKDAVDTEKFQGWLYKQMSIFGAEDNFIRPVNDEEPEPPEDGEETPENSTKIFG